MVDCVIVCGHVVWGAFRTEGGGESWRSSSCRVPIAAVRMAQSLRGFTQDAGRRDCVERSNRWREPVITEFGGIACGNQDDGAR